MTDVLLGRVAPMKLPKPAPSTKLTEDMWDSPRFLADEKLDGERAVLDGSFGAPRMISSGNTNRSLAVPHLVAPHALLVGTVFDGEVVALSRRFGDVVSVMHSGPEHAQEVQARIGLVAFHAFDVTMFAGKDTSRIPLRARRVLLEQTVKRLKNPQIVCVKSTCENKRDFYQRIVMAGGEGVVLKNLDLMYGVGWVKVKHTADVSAVITHVHEDRDAVELAAYDGDRLVQVGDCSIPTLDLKAKLRAEPTSFVGLVLDVSAYAFTTNDRLRNPVWLRFRGDLLPTDCTLSKIRSTFAP